MRKLCVLTVASILLLALAGGAAFAQNSQPASKATAMAGDISVIAKFAHNPFEEFGTILSNRIKTPNQKDLFLGVTMECGLLTKTTAKSKGGDKDTAIAEAGIQVQVLIDGKPAAPGPVTFCKRRQELSATFQGLIDGCLTVAEDGVNIILDEDCLEPEEVSLMQSTMTASGYNFIAGNLGPGVHNIEVQARIGLFTDAETTDRVEARGMIGKGSLIVEEVRMIKGEEYELY